MTRRQEIIHILQFSRLTLRQLSDEFLTAQEEVLEDLQKISSAIKPQLSLETTLPICNSCDFLFKDRKYRNHIKFPTIANHINQEFFFRCECDLLLENNFTIFSGISEN